MFIRYLILAASSQVKENAGIIDLVIDVTDKLNIDPKIGQRFGVELRHFNACIENDEDAEYRRVTIRGEVVARTGSRLSVDWMELKFVARASDGRIIQVGTELFDGEDFFERDVFEHSLYIGNSPLGEISIFAPGRQAEASTFESDIYFESQERPNFRSSGWKFEQDVKQLLEHFGYSATVTPGSGDHGVDVVAEKDGRRVVAQVKLHASGSIGNGEILKLLGGRSVYGATEALFITTSKLTKKAVEACELSGITYYDRDRLIEFCGSNSLLLPSWTSLIETEGGTAFAIPEHCIVGRDRTCDICIEGDASVSRKHFRLEWRGLQLWLSDLASTNGTTLDGHRVTGPVQVRYGATIFAGTREWKILAR